MSNNTASNRLWTVKVTNISATDVKDDSLATLHVPKESLRECNIAGALQRLSYFAFFKDSLFRSTTQKQQIASLITAVQVNCSVISLSKPIRISLHHSVFNEV